MSASCITAANVWWARWELHPQNLVPKTSAYAVPPRAQDGAAGGTCTRKIPGLSWARLLVAPRRLEAWWERRELHPHPPGKSRVFCC
jgi:hypothetical protein